MEGRGGAGQVLGFIRSGFVPGFALGLRVVRSA